MELGESPLSNDSDWVHNNAVNILTIHGAKGLEFPIVFLINLVSARFPTTARREQIPIPESLIKEELPEGDYHTEEERRLFYVGMTRAKDMLYMTAANYYGEGKREKKLSPFVYEVLGDKPVVAVQPVVDQISLLDWKTSPAEVVNNQKIERQPISYLSYSQIETFRLCPLHYKLRYMLNIPTPTSASLSFGTSIHNAMRDFYDHHARGEKVTNTLLLELLQKHWLTAGYESKRYEEEMKKRGEKYLSTYFDSEFNPKTHIVTLEQPFTVPLSRDGQSMKIGGKIDRIDLLPNGKIEIIDYKTGRMPSKREVDTNLQLSMYALAASEIPGAPFGIKPEDITLTLYFFDTNQRISTQRTVDQLELEKMTILNIAKEIEMSDFTCSGNMLCKTCEYQLFCKSIS
jgi:DNA helicase-2/ATP-dependent DNA helicase PcrA